MKTLPLCCLGLVLFAFLTPDACQRVVADDVTLHGVVRDTSDNILPGVQIAVVGTTLKTSTDEDGRFVLAVDGSKPIELILSKSGYQDAQLSLKDLGQRIETKLVAITDDTGLITYSRSISMSHSIGELRRDVEKYASREMDDELYREVVERYGEKPSEEAVFRIYLPKGVAKVNGLFLISEHGVGGPMMEHPMVREFADRHRLALVGILGNAVQRGVYPASTLDGVLVDIGDHVNHPEFGSVPVFTFGHSNGTGFSASYAAMRPDRVLGWVSFHSGGSWHLVFPGVEQVPGLVLHGNKDSYFDNGQADAVRMLRRERKAPIALLVDGESGHWPRDREATFSLVLRFCESCLRVRLPGFDSATKGVAWRSDPLQPADIPSGCLGQAYDREAGGMQKLGIATYADYQGDRETANWLADETFAKSWQSYGASLEP
ncbi:Dienelactone hydrolase [Neorhodopirellula lusitana]|uniref:Dienelactone hydrolase n=1 Tax=Neorhodopirellula lusitana TaxID=445327 RepID=A0ABY1QHQ7_9BACT|nr:carboxypeptidase-like regulatory domain-containing protein [Neorhodopirellula lusitana]SMP71874.1 Dienelactone hydrolase [Neorhodopirellula lusitana]